MKRLWNTFGSFSVTDEAMANAIQSGRVPLHGVPPMKELHVEIEGSLIREPLFPDIDQNRLYLQTTPSYVHMADFVCVEIDWKTLEPFARDALVRKISRPSDRQVEAAFAKSIEDHKRAGTRPSRKEHIHELRRELPGMTEAQYDGAKTGAIASRKLPSDWGKPGRIPK